MSGRLQERGEKKKMIGHGMIKHVQVLEYGLRLSYCTVAVLLQLLTAVYAVADWWGGTDGGGLEDLAEGLGGRAGGLSVGVRDSCTSNNCGTFLH